jgi:hypothetical protein
VALVSQVLSHQEQYVQGGHRFNVAALREALKVLVHHRDRTHRHQLTHRLHSEQVLRRVPLRLEMTVANSAAVVQADQDDKIEKNNWSNVVL